MKAKTLALTGAFAGAIFAAPTTEAGTILEESYTGFVELQSTDWAETLEVPQFDDNGGLHELVSVCIHLEGGVTGSAALESLDNAPTTIMANLSAEISLSLNGFLLGVVIPIANDSFDATAFDGDIDFAGTSGMTFAQLQATDSDQIKLVPDDEAFASFIGNSTIPLNGEADGASSGSGAGNLILQFNTQAEMFFRITYKYRVIPAPGTAAFLLAGMGLSGVRRRR